MSLSSIINKNSNEVSWANLTVNSINTNIGSLTDSFTRCFYNPTPGTHTADLTQNFASNDEGTPASVPIAWNAPNDTTFPITYLSNKNNTFTYLQDTEDNKYYVVQVNQSGVYNVNVLLSNLTLVANAPITTLILIIWNELNGSRFACNEIILPADTVNSSSLTLNTNLSLATGAKLSIRLEVQGDGEATTASSTSFNNIKGNGIQPNAYWSMVKL